MSTPKQENPSLAVHLQEEGFQALGLDNLEGSKGYHKYVQSYPRGEYIPKSPACRMSNFMVMKYGFPLAPVYNITCHEIAVLGPEDKRHDAIYAYSYWRPGNRETPEYLCIGQTYTSQDGEYRMPIALASNFLHNYANPPDGVPKDVFSTTELWIANMITDGNLRIDVTTFPKHQQNLADRSNELRLSIKMLVMQIMRELVLSNWSVHINPVLRDAIKALTDVSGFTLDEKLSTDALLIRYLSALLRGQPNRQLSVGQKLIPASLDDITRTGDIRCKVWREIWFARRASDITLNGLCGNLPFFNQWAAVRGTDEYIYDNEAMHAKYAMSRAAKEAMKHLQVARRSLLAAEGLEKHPRLQALDYEIHKGEAFAEQNVILSNITIITTTQHVGNTLGSFAVIQPTKGRPVDREDDAWRKLVFDAMYGALVLHDLGCHADLHMQNLTVTIGMPPGGCVLYVASKKGQKDSFIVPWFGRATCIIDFSRSIINPKLQDEIAAEQGSEQASALFREQAFEMLATVERWMPGFAREHQEAIKGAALSRPQHAYEAICFVDFLAIARDFVAAKEKGAEIGADVIKACARLERSAQRELLRRLKQLVAGEAVTPAREASVELLHEFVPQWLFSVSKMRDHPLVDAFYAEAPMRYSGSDIETYPEWAKPEDLLKYTPGKKLTDILERGADALYEAIRERLQGNEELELDIERMRGQLSDAPAPDAGGSWLM